MLLACVVNEKYRNSEPVRDRFQCTEFGVVAAVLRIDRSSDLLLGINDYQPQIGKPALGIFELLLQSAAYRLGESRELQALSGFFRELIQAILQSQQTIFECKVEHLSAMCFVFQKRFAFSH